MPPCGGNPPGSDQSRGSWARSQSQTKGSPTRLLYRTFQRSGHLPPPRTKSRTLWPTSTGPYLSLIQLSSTNCLTQSRTHPRYLNGDTAASGHPYAWKAAVALAWASSSNRCQRFCSDPLAHIDVSGWRTWSFYQGISMSYLGREGEVTILHDQYHVLYLSVHKVDPEGGPTWGP